MINKFFYGFEFRGILYGWKDKELYRLPQEISGNFYPLMKAGKWKNGYIVGQRLKSMAQLKSMTVVIDKKIESLDHEDLPF